MRLHYSYRYIYFITQIIFLWLFAQNILANNDDYQQRKYRSVLIISSYNPETERLTSTISDFINCFSQTIQNSTIQVENMNCKTYSTAFQWRTIMQDILTRHRQILDSGIVVTLGQEAWNSYIAQDSNLIANAPVVSALISDNCTELPTAQINTGTNRLRYWKDIKKIKYKAGIAYKYEIAKNIELGIKLYPKTKNVAFLYDNSLGGVCLKELMLRDIKRFPHLHPIIIDGQTQNAETVADKIKNLPQNTILLLGTWHVGKGDVYYVPKSVKQLTNGNPDIPIFTVTSIGMGINCIGGIVPKYQQCGEALAKICSDIATNTIRLDDLKLTYIPSHAVFDSQILADKGININRLPENASFINQKISIWANYKEYIIGIIIAIIFLVTVIFVQLRLVINFRRVSQQLTMSEHDLRISKDKAEESNKLKSAFIANMSHEIRTPLNAIVGFADLIAKGDTSKEEIDLFAGIINKNSEMLLGIINDILDLSRLESGRAQFKYSIVNIVEVCQNALHSIETIKKDGVELRLINQGINNYQVEVDSQKLNQILINLLSNACKFTKEGSIEITLTDDGEMFIVSVSDTGRGVPKEMAARIFQRFEKADEFVQGTGLGLSICEIAVKKMGGSIWLDTDYTEGARFTFKLPKHHFQKTNDTNQEIN